MKAKKNKVRGNEQSKALEQLKSYLVHLLIFFTLKFGEELYLYLIVSHISVSAVLLREKEGIQKPIFFTSITLSDLETRYSATEKLVMALIHAKEKFQHYLESHRIIVMNSYPLKAIQYNNESNHFWHSIQAKNFEKGASPHRFPSWMWTFNWRSIFASLSNGMRGMPFVYWWLE